MIPAYDVNDKVRLGNHLGLNEDETARGAFTTIDGVPVNPTTVSLELRKPDGNLLAYNFPTQGTGNGVLIQQETGRFYYDVSLDAAGLWHWSLRGTGAVETADRGSLYVRRSTI